MIPAPMRALLRSPLCRRSNSSDSPDSTIGVDSQPTRMLKLAKP
jgi:hypothetical protein